MFSNEKLHFAGLKEKYSGAFNHGLIPERIIDATESKGNNQT